MMHSVCLFYYFAEPLEASHCNQPRNLKPEFTEKLCSSPGVVNKIKATETHTTISSSDRRKARRRRLEFYQVTVAHARDRLNMHTATTQPIHVVTKSKLRGGTRDRDRERVFYLLKLCTTE